MASLHTRKCASALSDKHLLRIFILLLVLFIRYFINNFEKCFKVLRKAFNVLCESYFYKFKWILDIWRQYPNWLYSLNDRFEKKKYFTQILSYTTIIIRGCRVAPCESDRLISEASQDSRVQIHAFRIRILIRNI